jgi:SAM-dependent methyltransferase
MNIYFSDKLKIYYNIIKLFRLLPNNVKLSFLLNPIAATRYTEFAYLLKYLKQNKINFKNCKVLDVSSPFILSYFFYKNQCTTIKTDINPFESNNIKSRRRLVFKVENATQLSFHDKSFDIVYSISAIEHIFKDYIKAVSELIRVCKTNGIIYLTFPVAKKTQKEWLDFDIYPSQFKKNGKYFFQYRFDINDTKEITNNILRYAKIEAMDIFWEKKNGAYDKLVLFLRRNAGNRLLNLIKTILLNYWFGLFVFSGKSESFSCAKDFGNVHLILRKG